MYIVCMDETIQFEWDEGNVDHIARHSVTTEEAQQVICNEAFDLNYEAVDGEDRWTSIGHTNEIRVLKLVWTLRGEMIRIITAVDATKRESLAYLKARGNLI